MNDPSAKRQNSKIDKTIHNNNNQRTNPKKIKLDKNNKLPQNNIKELQNIPATQPTHNNNSRSQNDNNNNNCDQYDI